VDSYDYFARSNRLVVRMPTGIHGLLIASVDVSLSSQLEVICNGSDKAALFAQKVRLALSTVIYFPVDDAPPSTKSKHEPDASFWHDDAEYPGVIIEVSYSHKRKRLNRLAETYLLDSDASVQVVVGLDVEYGKKASREATLSVWRSRVFHTTDGDELGVVQEISDQVCSISRLFFWLSFLTFLIGVPRRAGKPYRSSRPTTPTQRFCLSRTCTR
jgi:hypothetical protein